VTLGAVVRRFPGGGARQADAAVGLVEQAVDAVVLHRGGGPALERPASGEAGGGGGAALEGGAAAQRALHQGEAGPGLAGAAAAGLRAHLWRQEHRVEEHQGLHQVGSGGGSEHGDGGAHGVPAQRHRAERQLAEERQEIVAEIEPVEAALGLGGQRASAVAALVDRQHPMSVAQRLKHRPVARGAEPVGVEEEGLHRGEPRPEVERGDGPGRARQGEGPSLGAGERQAPPHYTTLALRRGGWARAHRTLQLARR